MELQELDIADIAVGERIRRHLGDLASLAKSMRARTMLHPLVVTPAHKLVVGRRRLEAAKLLGWTKVPVRVVDTLQDAEQLLRAEGEENICREPFTPAEAELYQQQLIELERPAAKERQKKAGA